MSMFWPEGAPQPVRVQGRDVIIDDLPKEKKGQLWLGIKALDPARAESMQAMKEDPQYQQLQKDFGGQLMINEHEYRAFMEAGAQVLNEMAAAQAGAEEC